MSSHSKHLLLFLFLFLFFLDVEKEEAYSEPCETSKMERLRK